MGYSVLQHRQFFGDIRRQQVATGRENLPELDEDRPQPFQRQAQTSARDSALRRRGTQRQGSR